MCWSMLEMWPYACVMNAMMSSPGLLSSKELRYGYEALQWRWTVTTLSIRSSG